MATEQAMEPWQKLNDKVVLVTGASSGLGRDFCIDLAKAGCYIIAVARRLDRLNSLCHKINSMWPSTVELYRAVPIEFDVTVECHIVDVAVQKAWNAFGHIDCLINNAGVRGSVKSSLKLSSEEWDHVFKTNLTSCWLVSKYVSKRMCDAKIKGSIINISSIAGLNRGQWHGTAAYASSKAGLNMLTKVMAMELGEHKIRVNSISPGLFKSEITDELMQKKWLNDVLKKVVPLGTFGTSDPALTSIIRYLIHDSSEYVTGNNFIIDAGATLPGVPIYSSL
ncbi:hypothetical protein VNO78_21513 [Psophocarpus tetragonolobus]|uniref:3-oxoacyl-[acyl-carrier-protein] reductase n=1 Tax=Psophocarpus tetragonolobus TaxID=3891 RepID=A0AAN9SCG7_PSOTE